MSLVKKILTNSTLLLVSEVIEKLMRFVLVVFSARYLGDAGYGKFAFALAFTQLFLILMDLGIHQLLVREIARAHERAKAYLGNALLIKFVLSFATLIVLLAIALWTGKPKEVLTAVFIMAVYQVLVSFAGVFRSVFQAFLRMSTEAVATLILGGVTAGAGVIVLALGGGFQALAFCYLSGGAAVLLFCLFTAVRMLGGIAVAPDFTLMKHLIREGLPFGVLYFFAMMYTYIDTVMLSLLEGDRVVGWYNAAHRFMLAMMFIPTAMMKSIFPVLSKSYHGSMDRFRRLFGVSFKFMFLVGFTMAVFLSVLAEPVVRLVYGVEYLPAGAALKVLVWSTALVFITTVMTHATRASDHQKFTAWVVFGGALLNVILNLILIPRFSYVGAAAATLITQGFTFVSHFVYLKRLSIRPPFFRHLPRILTINLFMGGVVFAMRDVSFILTVPAGAGVFLLMLFLTRYFDEGEWAAVKDFLPLKLSRRP